MPIYEYRCERGHTIEVMQRMTEDPLSSCSTCGSAVQRVFHPVAVHFKGKGFYTTDYGKGKLGAGKADAASSDSKAGESKSTDSKSDGKPSSESTPAKASSSGSSD